MNNWAHLEFRSIKKPESIHENPVLFRQVICFGEPFSSLTTGIGELLPDVVQDCDLVLVRRSAFDDAFVKVPQIQA